MFENLLHQPVSDLLREDILSNNLPNSILFYGPEYSGKTTAALELARVISCQGNGDWTCKCSSCIKHKLLSYPDVLITGSQNCPLEIRACAGTFLKTRTQSTCFLFVRSVRKLIQRFNPVLWEEEESKISKAAGIINGIQNSLEELNPLGILPDGDSLDKMVRGIVSDCEKINSDFLPRQLPVNQVRKISFWAHSAPVGKKKVVIIENADEMAESARNAFLKLLEEPPTDLEIILLTTKRGSIMPTILSRVRTYSFIDRSVEQEREVLNRVFHYSQEESSGLKSFFYSYLPVSLKDIEKAAALLLQAVVNRVIDEGKKPSPAISEGIHSVLSEEAFLNNEIPDFDNAVPVIFEMLNKFSPDLIFTLFMQKILYVISRSCRQKQFISRDGEIADKAMGIIREAYRSYSVYNISISNILEKLALDIFDLF